LSRPTGGGEIDQAQAQAQDQDQDQGRALLAGERARLQRLL
jgi:hypothetical protein